jgi:hypothetical protein
MKNIFAIVAVTTFLLLASCKKETQNASTGVAQLSVITPGEATTFNKNETIKITASATHAQTMHGYEVTIHPANDTTAIFRSVNHTHGLSLDINDQWVNTSPAVKNQVVEVKVFVDHDGTIVSQKRNIVCN